MLLLSHKTMDLMLAVVSLILEMTNAFLLITLYLLRIILTMNTDKKLNKHHYLQFHSTAIAVLRWLHRLVISSSAFSELTPSLMLSFILALGALNISTIFS